MSAILQPFSHLPQSINPTCIPQSNIAKIPVHSNSSLGQDQSASHPFTNSSPDTHCNTHFIVNQEGKGNQKSQSSNPFNVLNSLNPLNPLNALNSLNPPYHSELSAGVSNTSSIFQNPRENTRKRSRSNFVFLAPISKRRRLEQEYQYMYQGLLNSQVLQGISGTYSYNYKDQATFFDTNSVYQGSQVDQRDQGNQINQVNNQENHQLRHSFQSLPTQVHHHEMQGQGDYSNVDIINSSKFSDPMETGRTPLNKLSGSQSNIKFSSTQSKFQCAGFNYCDNIHEQSCKEIANDRTHPFGNTSSNCSILNNSFSSVTSLVDAPLHSSAKKKDLSIIVPTTSSGQSLGLERRLSFFSPRGVKLKKSASLKKTIQIDDKETENAYQKELRRVLGFVHEKQRHVTNSSPSRGNGNDSLNNSFLCHNEIHRGQSPLQERTPPRSFTMISETVPHFENNDMVDSEMNELNARPTVLFSNQEIDTQLGSTSQTKHTNRKRSRTSDFNSLGRKYTRML